MRTVLCLFDLPPYDTQVGPALRLYKEKFEPSGVVALMREIDGILPALRKEPGRPAPDADDCQHWIDSLGPDAGYKPSDQTLRELAGMLIECLCIPHGLGFNPIQDIGKFVPWLSERSEWFADLMDGGEELAGGRLEFTWGSESLIATRQQIRQFREEVSAAGVPDEPDYRNLTRLLAAADANEKYTLLKTGLPE